MQTIYIKKPYINLGQFLKFTNLISSGFEAKNWLKENDILIDGIIEKRRGRKLYENNLLVFNDQQFLIKFIE